MELNKATRGANCRERGETQLGVIFGMLALGVLCWAVFTLQSCIKTHKDSKVVKRKLQYIELQAKKKQIIERGPQGRQLSY